MSYNYNQIRCKFFFFTLSIILTNMLNYNYHFPNTLFMSIHYVIIKIVELIKINWKSNQDDVLIKLMNLNLRQEKKKIMLNLQCN
jgi:hypothetical protein